MRGWQPLDVGGGVEDGDVEVFVRVARVLGKRNASVFAIGNAFGYSSVILGLLFRGGAVDVLDAEVEGACNAAGSALTRAIARASGCPITLTAPAFSPADVPAAARSAPYDLAFIDGPHTDEQLRADFHAVEPYLAHRAVVVLHSVGHAELGAGVRSLPAAWERVMVRGKFFKNLLGTAVLHRGFPLGTFQEF